MSEICTKCGKPNDREGRVMCSACAEKQSRYKKEKRNQYIAEGRCENCGRPLEPGDKYKRCPICREAAIKSQYKRVHDGRCIRCGAADELTRSGATHCAVCSGKINAKCKTVYYSRARSHCCVRCGAPLPDGYYYTRCPVCKDNDNAYRRELRRKKREARLAENREA